PKPGILAFSMWENKVNGYEEQEIFRTDKSVRNFQMLPDGSIVTSSRITSDTVTLTMWKYKRNNYEGQEILSGEKMDEFQILPSGDIVTNYRPGPGLVSGRITFSMWEDKGNGYRKQKLPILTRGMFYNFQMLPDSRIVTSSWTTSGATTLNMWKDEGYGYKKQELLRSDERMNRFQILPDGKIVVLKGSNIIILDGDPA
ncbi:MAG: hypothetical protein ACYDBX_00840, partial [Patescibacteria group bacterium]